MRVTYLLALSCMAFAIGCGTTAETELTGRIPNSKVEAESKVETSEAPSKAADDSKSDLSQETETPDSAKQALASALSRAKSQDKNLLVHFGAPG